jgi:hypothetical protein
VVIPKQSTGASTTFLYAPTLTGGVWFTNNSLTNSDFFRFTGGVDSAGNRRVFSDNPNFPFLDFTCSTVPSATAQVMYLSM